MHYEISCFVRSPSFAAPINDDQIKQCVKRLEAILARIDAQFTIELRDLKRSAQLYHSVHVGIDHCDLIKWRGTITWLQSQSLPVAGGTWCVSI